MEQSQTPETKTDNPIVKTSRVTAGILFLLLVLGVVFYTNRNFFVPQKVEVPEELILGGKIDSSKVRLEFPDPEKVDFAQYRTNKELPDVVDFYLNTFSMDGWSVIQSIETTGSVRISATNQKRNLNASIGIFDTNKGSAPILVAITFRKK